MSARNAHQAGAILDRAGEMLRQGQILEAREILDQAAERFRVENSVSDHARCLALAATASRLLGQLDKAEPRARRAMNVAPQPSAAAAMASAELAETLLALGQTAGAVDMFTRTLTLAEELGVDAVDRAVTLRRRAVALLAAGNRLRAAADLATAAELHREAGQPVDAVVALLERATALAMEDLTNAAAAASAAAARAEAMGAAQALGDRWSEGRAYLLAAAGAVEHRELDKAWAEAELARQRALQAFDPIGYLVAASTIADLADAMGDRVHAYGMLATAWVTLGDLLGPEFSEVAVTPKLRAFQANWGDAVFGAARKAYEDQRRTRRSEESTGVTDQSLGRAARSPGTRGSNQPRQ